MRRIYKNPPKFDNSKSRKVLGLEYTPISVTATDMAEAVVNFGFVNNPSWFVASRSQSIVYTVPKFSFCTELPLGSQKDLCFKSEFIGILWQVPQLPLKTIHQKCHDIAWKDTHIALHKRASQPKSYLLSAGTIVGATFYWLIWPTECGVLSSQSWFNVNQPSGHETCSLCWWHKMRFEFNQIWLHLWHPDHTAWAVIVH